MSGRSLEQEVGGRFSCRMVREGPVEKRLTGHEMTVVVSREVSSFQRVLCTGISWPYLNRMV